MIYFSVALGLFTYVMIMKLALFVAHWGHTVRGPGVTWLADKAVAVPLFTVLTESHTDNSGQHSNKTGNASDKLSQIHPPPTQCWLTALHTQLWDKWEAIIGSHLTPAQQPAFSLLQQFMAPFWCTYRLRNMILFSRNSSPEPISSVVSFTR